MMYTNRGKQMMMRPTKFVALVALTMGAVALGSARSEAGIIISVEQVGSNVEMVGSGSANLTALTLGPQAQDVALVIPNEEALIVGSTATADFDDYEGISNGGVLGPGGPTLADSGTGLHFGLDSFGPNLPLLQVPGGYVSGTALSSSSTYDNTTIAGLGLTPGTYVYSWGSGPTADSMTIQVGPAAVPEPASLVSMGTAALIGLAGYLRHRRRLAAA